MFQIKIIAMSIIECVVIFIFMCAINAFILKGDVLISILFLAFYYSVKSNRRLDALFNSNNQTKNV